MKIRKWTPENAWAASEKTYEEWGIILSAITSGGYPKYDPSLLLKLYIAWEEAERENSLKCRLVAAGQAEK